MKKRTLLLNPSPSITHAVRFILGHDAETVFLDPTDEEAPDFARLGRIDLVVGAPPIWADDEDASCDDLFEDAVQALKPELFLLETVRGLMAPRFVSFLEDFADDMADHGYATAFDHLSIGGRRRTVLVGRREDAYPGLPILKGQHRDGAVTIANVITQNLMKAAA